MRKRALAKLATPPVDDCCLQADIENLRGGAANVAESFTQTAPDCCSMDTQTVSSGFAVQYAATQASAAGSNVETQTVLDVNYWAWSAPPEGADAETQTDRPSTSQMPTVPGQRMTAPTPLQRMDAPMRRATWRPWLTSRETTL